MGFAYFRATDATRAFLADAMRILDLKGSGRPKGMNRGSAEGYTRYKLDDQVWLNVALREANIKWNHLEKQPHLNPSANGSQVVDYGIAYVHSQTMPTAGLADAAAGIDGEKLLVVLLPHERVTRQCDVTKRSDPEKKKVWVEHCQAAGKKAIERTITEENAGNWLLGSNVPADIIGALEKSNAELKLARAAAAREKEATAASSVTAKVTAWGAILQALDDRLSQGVASSSSVSPSSVRRSNLEQAVKGEAGDSGSAMGDGLQAINNMNEPCSMLFDLKEHLAGNGCKQKSIPTSSTRTCQPNWFIAGARKGGTTSLHTHLAAHPSIYGYHIKGQPQDGEAFYNLGPHAPTLGSPGVFKNVPQGMLFGESTVSRLMNDGGSNFVKYCNHTRIIVLLREPVARCVSQMRMRIRLGTDKHHQGNVTRMIAPELNAFVARVHPKAALNPNPAHIPLLWKSSRNCAYEGAYVLHLRRLLKSGFPPKQIRVI